jgi:hypothetical protein
MTCDDYLAMLETLPLDELTTGPAREHAARCHDCDRVTRVVVERERSMILAYGDVRSSMMPADVVHDAVAMARRSRIAGYYKAGLVVAAAATVVVMAMFRPDVHPAPPFAHEIIPLQCLSPDQAVGLLRSHVRSPKRLMARTRPPLGVIEIAGPAEVMVEAREVLAHYDDASRTKCLVEVPVPK